jgi:aspartate kinase
MKVYKFGGASVKDAEGVKNLTEILKKERGFPMIVVVSAMGKTTNGLEGIYNHFIKTMPGVEEKIAELKNYHFNIARQLFPEGAGIFSMLDSLFDEINHHISQKPSMDRDFEYDKLVSYGELLSTIIISEYLQAQGLPVVYTDVREIIKTDATFREARIEWDITAALAKKTFTGSDCIYLTQGFIGSTLSNLTTTLGREGSDYTAAILAHVLDAESVTIWKDVPGILNADPRWFPDTQKIDEISYMEAIELAYYGAQVIHPKTIKPLQNNNIKLYVKPFSSPGETGTTIHDIKGELALPPVYILKDNQVLISIQPRDFSFIAEENISEIFARLAKYRIKVNLMQNSAISFSIVCDNDESRIFYFIGELKAQFMIKYNQKLDLYTIRHYNDDALEKITAGKEILLQQKSRRTARFVLR